MKNENYSIVITIFFSAQFQILQKIIYSHFAYSTSATAW